MPWILQHKDQNSEFGPHPHHYFSSVDLFLLLILFLQLKTHSIIQSRAYDSQICRLCSAGQRPLLLNSCQKHLSNKETASTKINSKAENFCENLSRSATAQQMFHRTDRETFGLSVFWLSNGNNYNTEFPGWEASFIMFLASFFFFSWVGEKCEVLPGQTRIVWAVLISFWSAFLWATVQLTHRMHIQ